MKKNQKKLAAFITALALVGSVSVKIPAEYANVFAAESTSEKEEKGLIINSEPVKASLTMHDYKGEQVYVEQMDNALYSFSNGVLTIRKNPERYTEDDIPRFRDVNEITDVINARGRVGGDIDLVEKIVVEDGIKHLGICCFSGFNNVKSISLPSSLQTIGESAINGLDNLTKLDIPSSVREIQNLGLSNLPKIEKINIPSSVEYLGTEVINYNDALKEIEVNANAVVGNKFIANNKNLEHVSFGDGVSFDNTSDIIFECPKLTELTISGSDCTDLGESSFARIYNTEPANFELPAALETIQKYCFLNINAEELTIPSDTKTIGEFAFENGSIKNLTINGADTIKNNAFDYVHNIQSFSIKNVDTIEDNGFINTDMQDINLSSCAGINIGSFAFAYNTKLKTLTLPDKIGTLGEFIFTSCSSLTTVYYHSLSGLKEIPKDMFAGCTSLKSLSKDSTDTNTIYIPSGVETIGDSAFSRCTSITEITIPSSVTTIESFAFSGCEKLSKITIPENVSSIGKDAFSRCPELTIYGVTGSYAETYANENNIPFIDPNKASETPVTEVSVTEAPVSETTSTEAPVSETTSTEALVSETTSTEAPVSETTTTEAPVSETTTEAVTTDVSSDVTTDSSLPEVLFVGDLNNDGTADLTDLTLLSVKLMTKEATIETLPQADIDCNGIIDIADLARFKQFICKDQAVKELGIVKKKA